ncbi:unnamed protein product [Rotaria magnacalcarata]|uniref:Uncharacterized protein n=1 Tax=Rotaria magnacalcarata TaxID=392030 RepID=A0A815LM29_9BILA|nr:unnamed protein product [Rotaria magnacalcarata]CAF3783872.1 unnamed protein product [Rotaria magnacalcarata]
MYHTDTDEDNPTELEEVDVNDDSLCSKQDLRLAAIKEQGILLTEEITELCTSFRNRLRHGQVVGYIDILAKLYYDIACANYKYYRSDVINDNLISVKAYLEKCIEQFDSKGEIANQITIIKDAKTFLDIVCKKYSELTQKTEKRENDLQNLLNQCLKANKRSRSNETSDENVNHLGSSMRKVLAEIIQCNLEIGSIDQVEHYIRHLESLPTDENNENKLIEYKLRKEQLVTINIVMKFETYLLNPQDDDVESFVIKKPENISDYQTELNKWKELFTKSNSKSIVLIYNPEENINLWESWFRITKKVGEFFHLRISKESIISQLLKHVYHSKVVTGFITELLDLLAEKNVFINVDDNTNHLFTNNQFNLKSKRAKMIYICKLLRKAYRSIGYYPFEQRYDRAVYYFIEERQRFLKKISSAYNIYIDSIDLKNEPIVEDFENKFPLNLFPLTPGSSIKKLNDVVQEENFFLDILPYIDAIKDFQRSCNSLFDIDWKLCWNENDIENILNNMRKEKIYAKKFCFLLIQCNLYVISKLSREHPPINRNAIVLQKIENYFHCYFVKDNQWIKDCKTKELIFRKVENIDLENIQITETLRLIKENEFSYEQGRTEIEHLAVAMNLYRWYFYGKLAYGSISEGYVDMKPELNRIKNHLKDILPEDLQGEKSEKLIDREKEIVKNLSKIPNIDNEYSKEYILKPISKSDYEQQRFLKKGILIYDIRKFNDANLLKQQIKSDVNKNLACVVKLTNQHYICLFIESKKPYQYNYDMRYIHVLDSSYEIIEKKALSWLTGVMDKCVYKLSLVECPEQRSMAEDSLLHAFLNATACQWAVDNRCWKVLKNNFHRQKFSSRENIEKLKKWFVDEDQNEFVLDANEDILSKDKVIETTENFLRLVKPIIYRHLNPDQPLELEQIKEYVEDTSKSFADVRNFNDLIEAICRMNNNENQEEIEKNVEEIRVVKDSLEEKRQEELESDVFVDLMFEILKKTYLDLLFTYQAIEENFETFEDKLHHAILINLLEKNVLVTKNEYPDSAQKIDALIQELFTSEDEYLMPYINFVESLLNFTSELTVQCENIKRRLEQVEAQRRIATNKFAKASLDVVKNFVKKFVNIENSLKEFDSIFKCLLPNCYELLEMDEINRLLKLHIYEKLSHKNQDFDDIKSCIDTLIDHIRIHVLIKKSLEEINTQKLEEIYDSFNQCTKPEKIDERAIHYIGAYIRTTMMIRIDDYMNSLAKFRHESLMSIENFEKHLHEYLLNSIQESIRSGKPKTQVAKEALPFFKWKDFDYEIRLLEIKELVKYLANKNDIIPPDVINLLAERLDDTNHSHYVYFKRETNDLKKMLDRFGKVAEVLPKFSELFRETLKNRYDSLSDKEIFSDGGKIKKEIFNRLKPSIKFDDIENIIKSFDNEKLNISNKLKIFVVDNDQKASAEISQCLRNCIMDTAEAYGSSLLDFRCRAMTAFDHFEKNLYKFLSSYESVRDRKRNGLEMYLKPFSNYDDYSHDKYDNYLFEYKRFVNYLRGRCQCAENLEEIFKEAEHTFKWFFKERLKNLKIMLNSHINWYEIEVLNQENYLIFQIKTTCAILSEILQILKDNHSNCFCPDNEIRIINCDNLYIDTNLSDKKYSGLNIVLVSPNQHLFGHSPDLNINTDGKAAQDIWKDRPAKDGHGTDSNRNGKDGSDGKPGTSAGHVYVVANKLPPIKVSACGGQGGRGQDGGNGAPGLDGTDGKNADEEKVRDKLEGWWVIGGAWSYRCRRIGTDGTSGGSGGEAGSGGYHGEQGNPGIVKLVDLNEVVARGKHVNTESKSVSSNGKPGTPGEAGKHGRDGFDYVALSGSTLARRSVQDKRGRLAHKDRYYENERKFVKRFPMLSFEAHENNRRFIGKYDAERSEHRDRHNHRHKDQEVAKKIHAINNQHVFLQTAHFFEQYCNPENEATYQHWNASSLSRFLEKMADLENLPSHKINIRPDLEHDVQEILILKENFLHTVSAENQRLQAEKLDTNQLSIGILLLSQEVLNQFEKGLQLHQTIYQQLQNEIQRVDVQHLATGLEIRSTEIINLRNAITRILNEQRFSQRLAAMQRRLETLIEIPREELSKTILNRKNIQVIKENLDKQEWKKFDNRFIDATNFNNDLNEKSLLKVGDASLEKFKKIISETEVKDIELKPISYFINIYFYNFQQARFCLTDLKTIKDQQEKLDEIFFKYPLLSGSHVLDLFINFSKSLEREWLRHYWIIWTQKTLTYLQEVSYDNRKEVEPNLRNILQTIKTANHFQLEQIDFAQKSSFILKGFSYYDFDKDLYKQNRSELIKSINDFHENSNQDNLVKVFMTFSESSFFSLSEANSLQNLLMNKVQLDLIYDFLQTILHNVIVMNIIGKISEKLISCIEKIEEVLVQNPRSYLYDIFLNFSIYIEGLRIKSSLTDEQRKTLDEIYKSNDLERLQAFRLSKPFQKRIIKFTIEQEIDAFNTLYDPTLVENFLIHISDQINSPTKVSKVIKFVEWITKSVYFFEYKIVENIFQIVNEILKKTIDKNLLDSFSFLRIVFDSRITRVKIEKREEDIKSTLENRKTILNDITLNLDEINTSFNTRIEENIEKVLEFYGNLLSFVDRTKLDEFGGLLEDKLNQIATNYATLQKNLSKTPVIDEMKRLLNSHKANISSRASEQNETVILIDQFPTKIQTAINIIEQQINLINKQKSENKMFDHKQIILKILEDLFSNFANLNDNFCQFLTERLMTIYTPPNDSLFNTNTSHEKLVQQSKFCLFMSKITENIGEKLLTHLEQNLKIKESVMEQIERFANQSGENVLDDLVLPFLHILNLCELSPREKVNDILQYINSESTNINQSNQLLELRKNVLYKLINYYPLFEIGLSSISKYMRKFNYIEIKIEDNITYFEFILSFLYQERQEKTGILPDIYGRFYEYCKANGENETLQFTNFARLMRIISCTHRDYQQARGPNLVHALFQVTLVHVLLEPENPLGPLKNEFIDALYWFFQALSDYESLEKTTDINIEINYIVTLNQMCERLDKLCKDTTKKNINEYTYLKRSLVTICKEMIMSSVVKYITSLFEQNKTAGWLEVVIYFPELFEECYNQFFDEIENYRKSSNIDNIQDFIYERIKSVQVEKLNKLYPLINREKVPIPIFFKIFDGYLEPGDEKPSIEKKTPCDVINFNTLLGKIIDRIEIEGDLVIDDDTFQKVLQCIHCFKYIPVAMEKLSSTSQIDWLRTLLIEHIIEKYKLIFPEENNFENLRCMLMRINEKVLLLFNNVFIKEYIDRIYQGMVKNSNSSLPDYQKLTKDKFISIVNLMGKVSGSKQLLDQLADASLAVWDTILYEVEFSQIFNREMSKAGVNLGEVGVEKALLFLNRIRIQLGIENYGSFLEFFQRIADKINKAKTKPIQHLSKLLEALYYKKISFEKAHEIVINSDYIQWSEKIKEIESVKFTIKNQTDRPAREIIDQMKSEQNNKKNVISKNLLERIAQQASRIRELALNKRIDEGDEKSKIGEEIQSIFNLESYQDKPSEYVYSNLEDIVSLLIYSWSVANKTQFPKDTQIVALLLFIHSYKKGLLEQIRTGEGKTLIVGITAAFFALCGYAVDVVSSNRDLAIEGEQKCRSFFELLKLESGHICSEDDEVNHQAYRPDLSTCQGNIVYGEVGAFQRDILEEEFNNKKIFGKRYEKRRKCLIVDEVDNMCLDRARHVLYLSHEIESLKWLETLFINIWAIVITTEIKHANDIDKNIEEISKFILKCVENKNIYVPEYLHKFVKYKVKRWVDSAFQAKIMREDDHFVLDIPKSEGQYAQKQKVIIVLDKDTGVEQYSTRWSHGLAQFLELKYRRKLSVESLKAVFISNKAFFQRYKEHLYGLTGTLGSENSQSFLFDLYNVQFSDLPTSKKKCYIQLPSRVAFEYSDWLDLIAKQTIEIAEKRPVLIICENVEATEQIWNELIRNRVPPHTIEKYRRDGDNIEERFQKSPATAGDIIIATNKGGRGTDIHVDQVVNDEGGLHVILSYLPENVRVEEQAFGRTARNGAAGTGQFIIEIDKSIYGEMYELDQYPTDQGKLKLEELSDVILEREKINRDNKEAARLSELKQSSILRLEVEEDLFEKFNGFKKKISEEIFQPLLNKELEKLKEKFQPSPAVSQEELEKDFKEKLEKPREKIAEGLERILKDRWAFWLDEAKEDIDAIKTSQEKNTLLKKFDEKFVNTITNLLKGSDFDNLIKKFIEKPEEAIRLGNFLLSEHKFLLENAYSMAKKCFEKAIECGDISGFSYIGLTFTIINLKQNKETIKKQSRKELKKAQRCLELIKQNLMANLKIAEILPQSATSDIRTKISSKENLYEDQVRGKLEVIGLQLHYLNKIIGSTVEPSDFVLHTQEEDKFKKENNEKGEKLYNLLVEKNLIQNDQLRKSFKNDFNKLKIIIQENLDPSISDEIIELLKNKDDLNKKDFENIACYNDELWKVLNVRNAENIFILNIERVQGGLPNEYENIWKDLANQINPTEVNMEVFNSSSEKNKLKDYLIKKKLLVETQRVKINDLDLDRLNFQGRYTKYEKIVFNSNGHEKGDLKTFLQELKTQICNDGGQYLYKTFLPFGTQEEEGNKIRVLLKEKNIIKSGGLASNKYGNNKDKISEILDKILANTNYMNDKDTILSLILSLQGDIRSSEKDLKANLKDFLELEDQENVPMELRFFRGLGLDKFLIIQEDKSWWDWRAFAVAMIGLAQVIGGAVLISFGCVNIGSALIAEGISDMIYATMAGLTGTFSWKDWAIQKAISFTISLVTAGIGKLASLGSVASKAGSLSKAAIFAQAIKQAAYTFATTCATNILTDKVMQEIQNGVIDKIVKGIEENLLKGVHNEINKKVNEIYVASGDDQEFEKKFKTMSDSIGLALGENLILTQQFANIQTQVVSALKQSYDRFGDALLKSSSKYAKLVGASVKSVVLIDKLWNTIQPILKLTVIISTLNNVINNSIKAENAKRNHQSEYITKVLIIELTRLVRKVMSAAVNQIAKGASYLVKTLTESEFNGKNPIDALRKSNQDEKDERKSQVSVEQPSLNSDSKKEKLDQERRENLQNNIVDPKEMMKNYVDGIKDKDRPMGLAEAKMLAEKDMRKIVMYDEVNKEKIVVSPSGWKKIPAFFKQSAKINYIAGEDGNFGHFVNARGPGRYVQVAGRNDCLLIAYKESLGYTVSTDMIDKDREALYQYTARHIDKYTRIRTELDTSKHSSIIGGGAAPKKRNLFGKNETPIEGDRKRDPSLKSDGTYRTKGHEKERLGSEFGVKVSGKTHQFEHPVPWQTSAEEADPKLDRRCGVGGQLERAGSAYAEVKQAHRDHVGTGGSDAASKFSKSLGVALREDKNVSNAAQMSLVEYAHTPSYVNSIGTIENEIANDSYVHMVMSADSVPLVKGESWTRIPFDIEQKKECIVARWITVNGRYPSGNDEIKQIVDPIFKKYNHKL